jgi:thioredoxin 1
MHKTILSCVAAVMVLAACNNEASNKEAAASNPAAKEAPILDTSKATPVPATTPEPAPATTAAWKGVQEINDAAFADKVLNNPGLTIVDFNATWCGPCKMLKPIFDKAAKDFSGKASFASIDVDENPAVSEKYKIQSIPLLLFFKGGKVVKSIIGLVSAKEIYAAVEKNL